MVENRKNEPRSGERIAKVIARAGLGSRREVEEWIAAGRVAVDGAVIASPALNVTTDAVITVDGEPLPTRERTRLFLYNKARGLVSTRADPQGRPTVFEQLPKHLPRLISIGRLDFNTEGLLLLTNDGGLARVLELPDTGWLRRYRVRAHGAVTQAALDPLRSGVTIEGIRYGAIEATLDRAQGSNVWLTFAIREGKNREVRNVLGHLGLAVTRLIRVSFGPFKLGELAEGAVEEVRTRVLREQLGERVIAQSGADFSAAISRQDQPPVQPTIRPTVRPPEAAATNTFTRVFDAPRRPRKDDRTPVGSPRPAHPKKRISDKPKIDDRISFEGRRRRTPQDDGQVVGAKTIRKPARPRAGHAWREHTFEDARGKPLNRKFRGARQTEKVARQNPAAEKRAGLLTDRKGRRVLVERLGAEKPPPSAEPRARSQHPVKRGRGRRADRATGPRPGPRRPSRPEPR